MQIPRAVGDMCNAVSHPGHTHERGNVADPRSKYQSD